MFAQFLPDADGVPTTRSDTPRSSDRAERTVADARAGERQAGSSQPSDVREPKRTQRSDPDKYETEQSAEPVAPQQADVLAPDETVVTVVTATPSVAAPPVDPAITNTSIAISAETVPATAETAPTEPVGGANPGTGAPDEAPSPSQQAATVPTTGPAPLAEPAAEQPAVNAGATGNTQAGSQSSLGSNSDPLPSGEQTADVASAKAATNTPVDNPEPHVRSATPTTDALQTPTPTPTPNGEDREPGNPTIDAPKIAKPIPDAPEFGKPGVATDAQAGKSGELPVDQTEKPTAVPEDAIELPPREGLVRLDKVKPQNTVAKAGNDPVAEPNDEEGEKPPAAAIEERPRKPIAARETVETKAAKTHAQAEFRPQIVDPVRAEFRITDVKIAQPIDFSAVSLPSAHAAHSAAATTPAPAPAPVPIEGIAVAIVNNAQSGRNRFEIRLDPPELGRIDVRLHIDSKGQVTSHLIVDRVETLDLLRRDAADLERSLQQAGLKTSDSSLQFSLRDQSPNGDNPDHGHHPAAYVVVPDTEPAADLALRGYLRAGEGGGLDIRV
jgi:hypothetical protein